MIKRARNSKKKLILKLNKKIPATADAYDFLFTPNKKLIFKPGQYLGLILGNGDQDGKDRRRYFSIASSPTEADIRIGIKFHFKPNSLTQSMLSLKSGHKLEVSQLAGDFVLSKNKNKKLVFIAGGIGVTPFRSMIKYLLDTKGRVSKDGTRHDSVESKRRDIVLLYSNYKPADILYKDIFDKAEEGL